MRINTNMSALNAWRAMTTNAGNVSKALEKLSSGYRINRAADDAAGLAVSEKMRAQIRGTNMAVRNAQDGISLVQTAEGALTETHNILQRMRELSVQASTSTLNSEDSLQVQTEFNQLRDELNRIAGDTKFNTKNLLNGQAGVDASASSTSIRIMSGSGETKVGTTQALGSNFTAAKAATAKIDMAVGTLTGDASFTLNGKTINFVNGDTVQKMAEKINAASGETGVTASIDGSGDILLTSTEVGKNANFTASSVTAGVGADFTSTAVAVTKGQDASMTVGAAATSFVATGSYITVTGGDLKGLTFEVTADVIGAVTADVKANNSLKIQVGAEANQQMSIAIGDMSAKGLAIDTLSVADPATATASITALDKAINMVSTQRASLGAVQNRLEHTVASLQVTSENLVAAESRIRDVDMASEMANFTKHNILNQASQAMLAQANQSTQGILSLLR